MIPLSKQGYLTTLAAERTQATKIPIDYLSIILVEWARGHGGYPRPGEVAAGSAFGRFFVATQHGGWPVNPYTRPSWPYAPGTMESMTPGTAPGDCTYMLSPSGFTLEGHLLDGKTYVDTAQKAAPSVP
jgi:hypothetical protein